MAAPVLRCGAYAIDRNSSRHINIMSQVPYMRERAGSWRLLQKKTKTHKFFHMTMMQFIQGDRVEIVSGSYKPKRKGDRLFAKVVALAGRTKVAVALETNGKPIRTLALSSVKAVAESIGPAPVALAAVTCHALPIDSPSHKCSECEHLKQEVEILARALNDLCSLRVRDAN